jgi:hypothetical protein
MSVRPFVSFDADAPAARVQEGRAARLRTDAYLAFQALAPAFAFIRQRSNFILGWEAAAAAGGPLASGASAGAVGEAGAPALGSWMMLPDLTSPATQTVLPMNDSLYGAAHVELDRQGPVVLHVPADADGRYFSVTLLDGHFGNIAHLGPKWTGRGEVEVVLAPPGWSGDTGGRRVVESPTASVCLLNRALVRYHDSDLDRVRAWRHGFSIRPLAGPLVDVPHDDLVHPGIAVLDDPWEYLSICLKHVRRNPWPPEVRWVPEAVDLAALVDAADEPWSRAAVVHGFADAQAAIDATLTEWPTANGWRLPYRWIGHPTSHLAENSALQLFQVGSNDSGEAVYYIGGADGEGRALDGSDGAVYELGFEADALPPVDPDGFWSLTMYGPDNLLVANDLQRYSTRPTRPGFQLGTGGDVVITLSHALPAGVPEANWLPAPDGPFRLGLRLYYPQQPVVDGTWRPPAPRRAR